MLITIGNYPISHSFSFSFLSPQISSLIRQFSATEPVFVIIDVRPGVEGLPTTAYEAVGEVEADGKEIQRVFKHIKCSVEAEEAEEVLYPL